MKFISSFLILLLVACKDTTKLNTETAKLNMMDQARKMGDLLVKKEYESYSNYMHPAIIKKYGGREATLELIGKKMEEALVSIGGELISINFGVPSPIIEIANHELQATIPQETKVQIAGKEHSFKGTLISISIDRGKNWKYIDGAGNNLEGLRDLYPFISDKLPVPDDRDKGSN